MKTKFVVQFSGNKTEEVVKIKHYLETFLSLNKQVKFFREKK